MHNGKYQCHMAASCTYHLVTIISQLLNKSLNLNEKWLLLFFFFFFLFEKCQNGPLAENMTTQKEQEQ